MRASAAGFEAKKETNVTLEGNEMRPEDSVCERSDQLKKTVSMSAPMTALPEPFFCTGL